MVADPMVVQARVPAAMVVIFMHKYSNLSLRRVDFFKYFFLPLFIQVHFLSTGRHAPDAGENHFFTLFYLNGVWYFDSKCMFTSGFPCQAYTSFGEKNKLPGLHNLARCFLHKILLSPPRNVYAVLLNALTALPVITVHLVSYRLNVPWSL